MPKHRILAMVLAGGVIGDATIRNSVIRREVNIEENVVVEDCVIMEFCALRNGARRRRARTVARRFR